MTNLVKNTLYSTMHATFRYVAQNRDNIIKHSVKSLQLFIMQTHITMYILQASITN